MNILITNRCNRRCPYCFAAERISFKSAEATKTSITAPSDRGDVGSGAGSPSTLSSPPTAGILDGPSLTSAEAPSFITRDDFARALAFATRSKLGTIQILGGEPSLHPEFPELIEAAWAQDFEVTVFTNGLWPASHLERIKEATNQHRGRLALILNMNEPEFTPEREREQQTRLLDELGTFVTLSYNIFRLDFDPMFLVDRVECFRTRRFIRLGIAQPLAAAESRFVAVSDYARLAPKIVEFVTRCDGHDIQVGFDCGFVLCMFNEEQIGHMVVAGAQFKTGCGPAVDVGTDLSVWACFPLSTLAEGERLSEFDDVHAVARHFQGRFARLYRSGMLPSCCTCRHLARGQCSGGCAAHVYRSFNP